MKTSRRGRLALGLGLGMSLAVHAGLGVVAAGTHLPATSNAAPSQDMPIELLTLPPEEELRLGIEESQARTLAWLGFAESTPHSAPLSEVDQSALSPNPSGAAAPAVVVARGERDATEPAEPVDEVPAPPEPAPLPPAVTAEPESEPQDPEPPPEPAEASQTPPGDAAPVTEPAEAEQASVAEPAMTDIASDLLLAQVAEAPLEPPPDPLTLLADPNPPEHAESPEQENSAPPAPPPAPDRSAPPGDDRPEAILIGGSAGDQPGEQSPSESPAASTQETAEVRPGRVVAAQGLQITTVRPQFAITTIALASPRSPTVIIEFTKEGRVRRARFLPGQSTGFDSVDQPLLAAIYRWTAAGEPLGRLSDDPEDVITVQMRIVLR